MYSEGLDKKAVEERVLKLHHNTSQNRVDLYSGVCVSVTTCAGTAEQSFILLDILRPCLQANTVSLQSSSMPLLQASLLTSPALSPN